MITVKPPVDFADFLIELHPHLCNEKKKKNNIWVSETRLHKLEPYFVDKRCYLWAIQLNHKPNVIPKWCSALNEWQVVCLEFILSYCFACVKAVFLSVALLSSVDWSVHCSTLGIEREAGEAQTTQLITGLAHESNNPSSILALLGNARIRCGVFLLLFPFSFLFCFF